MEASSLHVIVNGQPVDCNGPCSIAMLMAKLGHGGRRVAVERNGEIVPRSLHDQTWLVVGDRLEVVVAVGGG
jgi:sulfur carrier protein